MLNRLRKKVETVFVVLATYTSRLGFTPNSLTILSLLVALIGFSLSYLFKSGLYLSLCIIISGLLDSLDGAVARLQSKETKRGAFLDSFIDRVSEAVIIVSFMSLDFNVYSVVALLALSNLVSYSRARGESLGIKLAGVGLMERAERLIFLAFIAMLADTKLVVAQILYLITAILTAITIVQRFMYVWRAL
ncbi:MAG: archaetidylinositol phosphate synthase [Desulfurococcaceae archaeon]